VTHYKVDYEVLRKAGLKEDGFRTFCGLDLRNSHSDDELHLIGPGHNWFMQNPVDCPTCSAIYNAIANHNLDRGN
jgi:hypothetical protein